jgi:hypothetical protein
MKSSGQPLAGGGAQLTPVALVVEVYNAVLCASGAGT